MSAENSNFLDTAALTRIRHLELRARAIVEGFWHGIHRSPYHGFSVEFTEYRPYTPGDDPRHLDWRLLARTDRCFIKKYEDETNLRAYLLVDQSRSMDFGPPGWPKSEYARTLAATLGYFLSQQGDAAGLLTFDESVREYLPARNRPGHLRQLMLALDQPTGGAATDLAGPLRRCAELVRRRGLIVLISDLLAPLESFAPSLGLLAAAGHEIMVFQVLDPRELSFDFERPARFRDAETGRDLFLDPALARADYVVRLNEHLAAVRALCERLGASYAQLPTNRPLELALFDFLQTRAARGKGSIRRQANVA